MTTSQGQAEGTTIKMLMPAELFAAAMKGDGDALEGYLGQPNHWKVLTDSSDPTFVQMADRRFNIQSATNYGNTILHLLVTQGHNELALKVFQKDVSLLKAQNKKFETPLHCAAKVGNENVVLKLIEHNSDIVKDALNATNDNGDTALHVAAKHGSMNVGCQLMKLSPRLAHSVNKEGSSPLHIAITNKYTEMAQAMLREDSTLACIEDSDGMFPVHVASSMGNKKLVKHFMEEYYDCAKLLDPNGRNLFHIAAEKNHDYIFLMLPTREDIDQMINARDYEGNTPLHIAAINRHRETMRALCRKEMHCQAEVKNKQGLTPAEICMGYLKENSDQDKYIAREKIRQHIKFYGNKFSPALIEHVRPPETNIWDRIQVIGLGAVLITTVAFAAAFTIPGGYNQENGTPILARRYIFKAFILANTLAFITGFISLFSLLVNSLSEPNDDSTLFPSIFFIVAATSMVVAFGLGLYLMLAPNNIKIAILVLVSTLYIGSPCGYITILFGQYHLEVFIGIKSYMYCLFAGLYIVPFLWIFCLAFL